MLVNSCQLSCCCWCLGKTTRLLSIAGRWLACRFRDLLFWRIVSCCEVCSMDSLTTTAGTTKTEASCNSRDTLTITDNRTGKAYDVPITNGTIRAVDLRQIKTDPNDFGMMSYDPAFTNTAACISRITYIDGDKGILRYRGYPIEELAEKSTYLETAYLIVKGELPNNEHLQMWKHNITVHTMVHENVKKFIDGFRYDAHPMGLLVSTI